jgi:arabinofuranan 3-O-arabinosyltransferase
MLETPRQATASAQPRGLLARQRIIGPLTDRRYWLIACCVVLVGLAFGSHPGQILADTKIDLAINPASFLQRALHLWDPAQFGQLQNQAVGYFFPIGPFFLLGKVAGLPGWITQRLWISFILVAAFLGVIRLCRALGIGSRSSQLVAAMAYALSPMALSLLGYDSAQVLPGAMLPWILVPLVLAVQAGPTATWGQRARLAAQSAVAVALCSGVNAAATGAVLVPGLIYVLAAGRSAPRWRILAWWLPAVLLATMWWLYPLVLLAKYGVSFLPYTESAGTTTSVTGLFDTLRGTEDWLTHLTSDRQAWLPAGFEISTDALPTIMTGVLAGLGLTGLVSRRMPHRRFLIWLLLAGILVVVAGSVSVFGNPLVKDLDSIINGPLAPLRNLDKFDPLIRLPIALGLASLLAEAGQMASLTRRAAATATASCAVGLLVLPVFIGGLSVPGSFPSVPAYWTSAAGWLNRHAGTSAVLEEPGARFGQYSWGSPLDDILQPLFVGDWASSQLGVIGSVGNTRLLETIDQQMSAGAGSAGLTQLLGQMGVRYVLVRNDLLRADLRQAWPARIHDALAASPGIVKVAQFGSPPAANRARAGNAASDFDPPYPPVEIYQVGGAQPAAVVEPTAGTLRVFGGPEAILSLADQGVLAGRPVLLNGDAPQVHASAAVVTDSLRRRVRSFGEIRDDYSPTFTAGQPLKTFEAVADFTEPGWAPYEAVAAYTGIQSVWASSSDSDIDAQTNQSGTGLLPFAAVDGDLRTIWESNSKNGPVGQWIRIKFDTTINSGSIRVAFADNPAIGPAVRRVQIRTHQGNVIEQVRATSGFQVLRLPRGPTDWLRIKVLAIRGSARRGSQVGVEEISVPGVRASRTIEAPNVPLPGGGDPAAVVLAKEEPQPTACMLTPARWVCSPSLATPTEEQYGFNESFTVPRASPASLSGSAVLINPALIRQYAYGSEQATVSASSTYTPDPQDQSFAAFDGSQQTAWLSGATDTRPSLTIGWRDPLVLSAITVLRPAGSAGPLPVQITGSADQTRSVILGGPVASGRDVVHFAPMRTSSLTLTFVASYSSGPVEISDVDIPGVPHLVAQPSAGLRLGCGSGPAIRLDGRPVATRVSGTVADILTSRPLTFTACGAVSMAAGHNTVVEPAADAFSVQGVALARPGALSGAATSVATSAATAAATPARVVTWTQSQRVLQVAASHPSYLIVNENFNAGWQAVLHGRSLQPVRLDGWKQGWLLPAGSRGLVTLTYLPDAQYRAALFTGLAALGLILLVAVVPFRRRLTVAPVTAPVTDGPQPANHATLPAERAAWGWSLALLLTGLAGLWTGGYAGVVLLPALTLGFIWAIAWRPRSRLARVLAEPWLIFALLAVAAVCGAAAYELYAHGIGGVPLVALGGVVPEVACLAIAGRVIAALLTPDG